MALDPVVVGVDGSDASMDAVAWAARDADLRGRALRVVHAFIWPAHGAGLGAFLSEQAVVDLQAGADAVVAAATEHADQVVPGIQCHGELIPAAAAPTLIRESQHAELLVVGSRGLGGFAGLLLGSVGTTVAAHAASPVVVVRSRQAEDEEEDETGPEERSGVGAGRVVVGVDGSAGAEHAVRFAFEEAARRRVGLTAVYGWDGDGGPSSEHDADTAQRAGSALLADALDGWSKRHPDVDVRAEVVHATPAQALVEAGRGAVLVVVGSRGRGGFRGLLLGSVSQAVLQHAPGPVAVVRKQAGDQDPPRR